MENKKRCLDDQESSSSKIPKRNLSVRNLSTGTTDKGYGLKNTLHGVTYQLKLLILILLQAAKEMKVNKEFECSIRTEDPKYGKFNDIVFRFTNCGLRFLLCIQTKHKEDATKSISWNDLISTTKDSPYSISKYFNSFLQQKTDGTEKTNSPAPTLVLCTNIGLEQQVKDFMADAKQSFEGTIVGSFFESLKSDIYTFDLNKIKEKDDKELLDFLAENSDFKQLSKMLARCIYNQVNVDFRNPLFERYRGFIQNKIVTNSHTRIIAHETGKFYEVNVDFFDDRGNEEFKKDFETEYRKLKTPLVDGQEPNNQDIWPDVLSKGIKVNKETKSEETIVPKKIEQSEIENFFKSFIIAPNTFDESELSELIVNEIKKSDYLPPDTPKTVASNLARDLSYWILEWMKHKQSIPLRTKDIHEYFEYYALSLKFLHFEGMSQDYCGEIQKFKLKCKPEILKKRRLYQTLALWLSEPGNGGHKVDIWKCNEPSWVVLNTLELCKSNQVRHSDGWKTNRDRNLTYLFLEDRQFEKFKQNIMNVFLGYWMSSEVLILVVECKQNPGIAKYLEWQVEGMSSKTFKKVILIDQTYNTTEFERDLLIRDLTDESRKQIINQTTKINFFGSETSISELILDEDNLDFVLDIVQLSSEPRMKCNKFDKSFGKIQDVFIHRKWERCDKNGKLWQTSSSSFWSARKEGTTLTKLLPDSEAENKISYKTFLDHNNLDNEKFNRMILLHRHRIQLPGLDGNTQDQVESNKSDRNVHVIFNEAGSGKSFYLIWLATHLQDMNPSWWIIKFNLNEYGNEFGLLQERGELETKDELITIRFLFQLVYLAWFVDNMFVTDSNEKSNRARKIAEALEFLNGYLKLDEKKTKSVSSEELILLRMFEHKFNSNEIVILMDGFDEIAPNYKTVVLNLLSMLKTFDGICKLYISSRPYGLRNEVETALQDCACYRLVEFDEEDQYSFIDRYLLKHFDEYKSSDNTKQARTCGVVFAILREFLGDLTQIPLYLSMGIDLLMPMVKMYVSVGEETISKQIIGDCENSFEPLSMMESFVEKKLEILNIEKTSSTIAFTKTFQAMMDAEKYVKKVNKTHSLLALYTIMSKDEIDKLLTNEMQNTARQYMENVNNGSEKLGLIEGVVNSKPIFNHMLFADYYAALWFYSNQNVPDVKDFLKREIYATEENIEIRQFLDRMICRKSER